MVVKKYWFGRKKPYKKQKAYCGWFLFGVIPLYIREVEEEWRA